MSAIILVSGFFLGIIFSALYLVYLAHIVPSDISLQIDPSALIISVVGIFVSIFLAVYLLRRLQRHDDSEKSERNLLTKYLESFSEDISKSLRRLNRNDVELSRILETVKMFQTRSTMLIQLIAKRKFIDETCIEANILHVKISTVSKLMTYTKPGVDTGVQIRDDRVTFMPAQRDRINHSIFEVSSAVFDIIARVTNAPRKTEI